MKKKTTSQADFHTSVLLALAVAGLVITSGAATVGIAKLAYDFQMSLPAPTQQVAAVAGANNSASGLTDAQISAVLTLLSAFGAPQDTVTSVSAILRGEETDGSEPSGTRPPTSAGAMQPATTAAPAQAATAGSTSNEKPRMPLVCPTLTRHLNRGNTGDDVAGLQKFLAQQGVLGTDNVSGTFGTTTERALAQWQMVRGIVASTSPDSGAGEVGTLTRQAIMQMCSPPMMGVQGSQNTSASSTAPIPPKPPTGIQ